MPARRTQAACDRILDAAGELFAQRGVTEVLMSDIAAAAGCSRATLYRYFENREALHTAYVSREAREVNLQLAAVVGTVKDPGERLLDALTHALRLVRKNPALSAWFARTPIGADAAEESEVVQALTTGFLLSLEPEDVPAAQRRARWLVRILTSLLIVPGRDADDERAMLREFVVPTITGIRNAPG
ncbi:TetR/AcrR family transcriptional regulator [Mycolicibacterium sp.]|uniref:TetR/AcrR family transcriptional regulator n=1 Tax=Mycolicibacterium sp. TaxID=2320850 RepID=UPI001DE0714B|nr:TetR/AcrR family transcriptional regulator [Mycolicibacterium sp.]MCB1291539.1 TetR/AcrR family transcriptional regulator [Mycobacterium sp.]MCB9411219.1 TetR/AcrR family transcriptional regulator [Mycolicibacterium sp.]